MADTQADKKAADERAKQEKEAAENREAIAGNDPTPTSEQVIERLPEKSTDRIAALEQQVRVLMGELSAGGGDEVQIPPRVYNPTDANVAGSYPENEDETKKLSLDAANKLFKDLLDEGEEVLDYKVRGPYVRAATSTGRPLAVKR